MIKAKDPDVLEKSAFIIQRIMSSYWGDSSILIMDSSAPSSIKTALPEKTYRTDWLHSVVASFTMQWLLPLEYRVLLSWEYCCTNSGY